MGRIFPDSNIPVIQHLTYQEVHRFTRGAWIGFAIAMALFVDQRAVAFALLERAHKRMQSKHEGDRPDRLTGLKRDAWYLFGGCLLAFFVTVAVVSVAGLGTVRGVLP